MTRFDRVLSDEEIDQIVNGLIWASGDSFCFGKDVATHIIQAMQDKLGEKEPAAWRVWNKTTGFWGYSSTKPSGTICEPLYTHPMPCVSNASDKTACVSENGESETQTNSQGLLDSSNESAPSHIVSTSEDTVFSARDLCPELGYVKWDNFNNLILRASQMISNGLAKGSIKETERSVTIGYGAKRQIIDYQLDGQAKELVCFLAGSFKLNRYYALRNETAILSLVKKWCDLRGVATHHQKEVDGFFVDLQVGESISIEFDEPHHAEQKKEDEIKTKALQAHGNRVLRFGIDCDVIDIITELEKLTPTNKMITPLAQRKIQTLLDKGEYRVIENATVLVNENGHAAIINRGGAFYWVDNEGLAREFDAAPKYTGEK